MKILDSAIRFSAAHLQTQNAQREDRVRFWLGAPPLDREKNPDPGGTAVPFSADRMEISPEARSACRIQAGEERILDTDPALCLRILIVEKMVKLVTGREVKIVAPDLSDSREAIPEPPADPGGSPAAEIGPDRSGWGLEFSRIETFTESEHLDFQAQGIVRTSDGREYPFQAGLRLERRFFTQNTSTLRAGDAVQTDPLAVNWDGLGVRLTSARAPFDLNGDGTLESIPGVQSGSAFLALDLNRDGRVNDGQELFGPRTGNGFDELARYDQDGSGWIDEADPIFSRLQIWTKDQEGVESLQSLAAQGIGAIYLNYAASPFQIKSATNESLGEVVRSGIYLKEDGQTGLVQQVNLTT